MDTVNALIEKADLVKGTSGVASIRLDLKAQASGATSFNVKLEQAGEFLDLMGVKTLAEVVGKPIRVRIENLTVKTLGHFIHDDWLK